MADPAKTPPSGIEDRDYYSAIAHFYRGELGRTMVWRQRLDTTTNWAVVAVTGLITFGLSHPEVTHLIFMVGNIMMLQLLFIEGRRYRYYDAFRARVRMLEAHFLAPLVIRQKDKLEGEWRQLLAEDMLLPSFKIGILEAVSRRFRRNYAWIFLLLLTTWCIKIFLHPSTPEKVTSVSTFLRSVEAGQPLNPILFWALTVSFYCMLLALGFYSQKGRYASGELQRRGPSRNRWKI